MKTLSAFVMAGSFTGLVLAVPLGAQQARVAAIELAPYAGYVLSASLVEGPMNSGIVSAGRPLYGVQLGIPVGRDIALIGNLAHAEGDLAVGLPIFGAIPVGRSATWMMDAGFEVGMPMGPTSARSLTPFLQLGAGAMRQSVEISGLSTSATNLAFNVGAGLDLAFSPNMGLRLMAKDYIGKFDIEEATTLDLERSTAHNVAITAGLRLAF